MLARVEMRSVAVCRLLSRRILLLIEGMASLMAMQGPLGKGPPNKALSQLDGAPED